MKTHPLPLPRASVSRPIGFTAAEVASVLELKLHHSRDRKMATAQQECNPIRWECSMLRNRTRNPFIRNTACLGTRDADRAADTERRRETRTAPPLRTQDVNRSTEIRPISTTYKPLLRKHVERTDRPANIYSMRAHQHGARNCTRS